MEHTIAKEITRRERLMVLKLAGKRCTTALYTPSDPGISEIEYRGIVSAYDEAPYVYRDSAINLNMTLKDITSGIPLRVIDIMGAGGFLLTNRQIEIEECFEDGKELIMYDSIEDAIKKAEYYLEHENERKQIAAAGRQAVIERFSFEKQVKSILKTVFGERIM